MVRTAAGVMKAVVNNPSDFGFRTQQPIKVT